MKTLIKILPLLIISSITQAAYEDHFPVYYEYCTGTQWKPQGGEPGGSPGHGFTYIHGLCKDYRSAYPQVIPCSDVAPALKEKYPHEGVGISLDKNFKNVMWVAVPGRDMILNGNQERRSISLSDVDDHIERITELKVFDKVISDDASMKNIPFGTPEYLKAIAESTLGTDHAVNWARELHCVKIPANKNLIWEVAKFLNDSNNQYKTGKQYEWSKISNNCVHLSINTSNALGLTEGIKTDQKYIGKLMNLALPANGFLMFADEAVLDNKPTSKEIKKVLSAQRLPVNQVGSLMSVYKAYPSGEKFDTSHLEVLTLPDVTRGLGILDTPRKYEAKHMTAENSKLKANARMWAMRYGKLIDDLKPNERNSYLAQYLMKQKELAFKILRSE